MLGNNPERLRRLRSAAAHVCQGHASAKAEVPNQLPNVPQTLHDNVAKIEWWRSMGDMLELNVCDRESALHVDEPIFDERRTHQILQEMREEGYVRFLPQGLLTKHLQKSSHYQNMCTLIDHLHVLHIPPVFCFMFDEFWMSFIVVNHAIRTVLGEGFLRLSDFWAWRVDSETEQEGWSRHRERVVPMVSHTRNPYKATEYISHVQDRFTM